MNILATSENGNYLKNGNIIIEGQEVILLLIFSAGEKDGDKSQDLF